MYLVAGATGNVGSEVVEHLLASGEKVRVFTRDAGKVARWGDRVEVATGDFGDAASFAKAIAGARGAFVMNGALDIAAFRQLVAAAKAGGTARLVFLSTILAGNPESEIGQLHKVKEDAIRESGLDGKFVRAGGFMSNSYQWAESIKAKGVVYNALGTGKSAPIAPEDIAAVAAKALTNGSVAGEIFEVTGAQLLSVPEQVDIVSRVLGKAVQCVDVPVESAVEGLIHNGVPAPVAAAVGQSFAAIREGRGKLVTETVKKVTGQEPLTYDAWVKKHASRFA